ncbi:MAG: bifunctional pyr operon transcriptional regulator/uracil phosphoribosyltransferase PyrR [Bacteroidia bacterium]|nr:bifunctional pyr operon transcriptional regulator/uracil phosphoribosyltransferase PyrR [Bacteroidia bacterium]MCX7652796.1 bifunctional pyr operon transcriptional regulator/uracil phosphoribosyltransferase PyrR [Bacteroidia bacterium]MDW8417217.1 bifunctional pyr operon transcriptional regulator/uracil phosphoribosyltransferase PyrR [Bacteroidia bacterium]
MQRIIAEGERIQLSLRRMARQIIERHMPFALIGIEPRGSIVAKAIHNYIQASTSEAVLLGTLDITLWRDDLHQSKKLRIPHPAHLPFPIEGKSIWLIDDVLYTGRTVRAALDALREIGRPSAVRLAVLVERRGMRELPLAPDCVGFVLDTHSAEKVIVRLEPNPLIRIEQRHDETSFRD